MAISNTNWNLSSDPFIMAAEMGLGTITYYGGSSFGTTFEVPQEAIIASPKGMVNLIVNEPDVQEIYFQKKENQNQVIHPIGIMHMNDAGGGALDFSFQSGCGFEHKGEQPDFLPETYFVGVNRQVWDVIGSADPTHLQAIVAVRLSNTPWDNATPGTWKLFIFTAYCWNDKDPVQVAFSWLAHYLPSGASVIRDLLDKSAFQALSDAFDNNPMRLDLWREAGTSIAEQMKTIFKSCRVYASINQRGQLTLGNKDYIDAATLQVDPTDPLCNLVEYNSRIDKDYRLGTAKIHWGRLLSASVYWWRDGGADPDDIRPDSPITTTMFANTGQGGGDIQIEAREVSRRHYLMRHWDFHALAKPKRICEFTQGPQHFAYDLLQQVPVIDAHIDLDTTSRMICNKKVIDLDSLSADVTLLEETATVGLRPFEIGNSELLMWHRAHTQAKYGDGILVPGIHDDSTDLWNGWPLNRGDITPGGGGDLQMTGGKMDLQNGPDGWPCLDMHWIDDLIGTAFDPETRDHGYQLDYGGGGPDYTDDHFYWTWVLLVETQDLERGYEMLFDAQNPSSNRWSICLDASNYLGIRYGSTPTFWYSNISRASLADGSWHVLTVGMQTNNLVFFLDGSKVDTVAFAPDTCDMQGQVTLFGPNDGSHGNCCSVRCAEMGIMRETSGSISESDIEEMHTHLLDGYGLA